MSAVGEKILAEAQGWVGTPYRHQASRKGVGCDCLGFVRGVWRAVYGRESEQPEAYGADWAVAGDERLLTAARRLCREKRMAELSPGDLIVFRWRRGMNATHLGIVSGEGRFLHAYERHAVISSPLGFAWRSRIAGVFAFPDPQS